MTKSKPLSNTSSRSLSMTVAVSLRWRSAWTQSEKCTVSCPISWTKTLFSTFPVTMTTKTKMSAWQPRHWSIWSGRSILNSFPKNTEANNNTKKISTRKRLMQSLMVRIYSSTRETYPFTWTESSPMKISKKLENLNENNKNKKSGNNSKY